ncbi:MAG: UPF0147 family protein [Nanoarchaeota archaeon]|nr:UPF0147 family protein [Nanoarchaeota archaeon]MBU1320978.1 UPF0147 family protein [Nanoarchaeota archaeon]MBU1598363.1 UPF0147 family protein [Nanoarchaeota archaeon]MBU2441735.1 UPF0147 family protein [Nanoarchaeota archaeon]
MVAVEDVIELVSEIIEDQTLPKNIKAKLSQIVAELKETEDKDVHLKADQCINELEDISSDVNLQPFVRTQIWSIVSMLESLD